MSKKNKKKMMVSMAMQGKVRIPVPPPSFAHKSFKHYDRKQNKAFKDDQA